MKALLQVDQLGFKPDGIALLNNINLTLSEGQFTLITGRPAVGKARC
jgi:hypothetical protein